MSVIACAVGPTVEVGHDGQFFLHQYFLQLINFLPPDDDLKHQIIDHNLYIQIYYHHIFGVHANIDLKYVIR